MRRLTIVALIILIVALAWSGGWFALASWAEGRIPGVLAEIAENGLDVDCRGRDVTGFPFALRLACGKTEIVERVNSSRAELAGVTGGASVFAPMTAEIALDAPASLQSPLLTGPADFRWEEAAVDVGMGLIGPRTWSFDASNLVAEVPVPEFPGAVVAAETAAGTLVPSQDGGTDAALSFTNLALSATGTAFPPFDADISVHLSVPPQALLAGRAEQQTPLSVRDLNVLLAAGAAQLAADGDVSINAEGIMDGTITLTIAGAHALPAFIAALPAKHQKLGNAVAGGLLAFGQPTTLDGEPASELVVEIKDGRAKVGPVEVSVPRLPL